MADLSAVEAFLAEPRNVVVAAIRRDGRPQMTPNWFLWDGSRFWISTTKDRWAVLLTNKLYYTRDHGPLTEVRNTFRELAFN